MKLPNFRRNNVDKACIRTFDHDNKFLKLPGMFSKQLDKKLDTNFYAQMELPLREQRKIYKTILAKTGKRDSNFFINLNKISARENK